MVDNFKDVIKPTEVKETVEHDNLVKEVTRDFIAKCASPFHHNYENSKIEMYKHMEKTEQMPLKTFLELEGVPGALDKKYRVA